MGFLINKAAGFRSRLTCLNEDEPITKLALCFILLLDIFILSIIFGGLEDHTNQLTSPDEYFPQESRIVFIQNEWTTANRMDKLQHLVLMDYQNYSYRYQSILNEREIEKMHPTPGQFFRTIKEIAENKELEALFIKRQSLLVELGQINDQFRNQSDVYSTTLMGNNLALKKTERKALSKTMQTKANRVNELNSQLIEIDNTLNQYPAIETLWTIIQIDNERLHDTLVQDLNGFERFYKLKEFLWQLVFLLPLFAVALIWHSRCLQKDKRVQTLISAHLLVLVAIPIVFRTIHLVLDLIPYDFFDRIFVFFEKLRLIALWHYLVIFIAIMITISIVYFIQQKVFNKSRLNEKRLAQGECVACGKRQPGHTTVCPYCGSKQLYVCSACELETPIGGAYCIHCGQEQGD